MTVSTKEPKTDKAFGFMGRLYADLYYYCA